MNAPEPVNPASFRVTFLPERRTLVLDAPLEVSLAAARCDIWLEHPCGAGAICGDCRVRVWGGSPPMTPADARLIDAADLAAGWRLGCQLVLTGPCSIEIPPQLRAVPLKSFGPESLPAGVIEPQVPDSLVIPGTTPIGVAVDMGSTTLAAALVNLRDGRVIATSSCLNPQVQFGADIMSRIHFAQQRPDGNRRLHDVLVDAVGKLIAELTASTRVAATEVVAATCVGNATMTHAAVGADVRPLGEAPYEGSFLTEQEDAASAFGWPVHPGARVRFVPMIGSHVGGDTVAAILACDIDRHAGWHLLIDLGTNAEVVVGRRDRIVATSTAAGPAFDGANITCGMRAVPGAIDGVHIRDDGHLVSSTIGGRPALGLCGSGLVDAVAELLKVGVVAPSGYMRSRDECEALGVPAGLLARITRVPPGDRAVQLTGDVLLSARDVRQLQLAKGSIAAGVSMLMDRLGLSVADLDEILVAGTFGTFLRKESLAAIGLVPPIDPQRVRFVGNAAGAGARLILVDGRSRRRAIEIARRSEHVELAGDPDYESAFCAGATFPGQAARSR